MGACVLVLVLSLLSREALAFSHDKGKTIKRSLWEATSSPPSPPQNTPSEGRDEGTRRIAIVGSGVGGLATAARIASSLPEAKVTIYEKNDVVGGRCGSFHVSVPGIDGTFRHERGPSLLLLPDVYKDLFRECGSTAEDNGLIMRQCVPAYQVVFDDGDRIELGYPRRETELMSEAEIDSRKKMDSFESKGAEKWDEYMKCCSAFLDCGLPNFIEERLELTSFPAFMREALRDFGKAWPLKPHSDVLDAIFDSEKMRALASFQDLYVGLEPYRNNELVGGGVLKSTAPAVFGLLAAIELHPSNEKAGVFAPIGGFESVSRAMAKLATELGVEIVPNALITNVQKDGIFVSKNGELQSRFIPSDVTIVNADLPYSKKSIMPSSNEETTEPDKVSKFDWDDTFSYSSGVVAFHWSIDKPLDDLNTHNVFMSASNRQQSEASWQVLRKNSGDKFDGDAPFNFYVHRATKTDATAAPNGRDAIMVLVPCRTLLRDSDCAKLSREESLRVYKEQFPESEIEEMRQAVMGRLSVIDSLANVRDHIVHETVDTPGTWADQFHLAAGTPFALSHGFSQLSLTRPSPGSSGVENVLYCGASTRPGNGVPLVLVGAKQVAAKAVSQLRAMTA